ncbi:MAG: bifunctional diaminohydroxyphosphoribosylaminopyrimidine deaminase/5-amino-6-(5-phosphoribosylamino)uracil reductase RibD [Bacteroidales bacterium]|jgi:diaminohydroxyphosphoribosylaminopyrimidine deaminase/5-amino-6-(5-phosphoribosylamino)uracil reductase|nr:bifunctional diaminohydroxyphosphoribosylaminopyrimidine deaminase/5-amino-6-(5-phosphoribosylamino)uracil reductase RibD [Bacteroidales bacterium]
MTTPEELTWMRRAIRLAAMAEGNTAPNPMVGAVVVHDGIIIGEGYHLKAGTPHAEVHAINAVTDRSLLSSSTMYVSLEPCSHHGRTPPCADLIINSGIRRVVVGVTDPNPLVSGKGITRMREAGIEVVTGVAEDECRILNRRFFTWHEKKRPYVILKWARSADGFIDLQRKPGDTPEPNWITGMSERVLVHRWRAAEDAILAGGGTIRADNPSLTVRYWSGKNPVRVIISRSGDMDHGSSAFNSQAETILFTCNGNVSIPGVKIIRLSGRDSFLQEVLPVLHEMGIQSLFVEGGACIIRHFAEAGLWDEARRFTGNVRFNEGVPDPFPEFTPAKAVKFDKSILEFTYHF